MTWWHRPLRAIQVNIEDPYGFYAEKVDAGKILDAARRVRANLIVVFARDPWGRVFYKGSKLYPRHHNSRLDIRELVDAARREGIHVVIMAAHTANRYLYRLHPSWAQRTREGEVIVLEHYPRVERVRDPHWPQICLNSPALERYFAEEVREALEFTGADGVLLDSFRYMPDPSKACYCSYCRSKFRDRYGMELPSKENMEDESFRLAWQWRYEVVVEAMRLLRSRVKQVGGDKMFFYNSHPAGWAGRGNIVVSKARDILDAVFAEASEADIRGPGMLTLAAKISRAMLGRGKPVIVSRNAFYALRTVQSATPWQIRMGIWEIVAAGGHPMVTIFSSQLVEDPRALDYVASAYEVLDRLEDVIDGQEPIRFIGIVFDPETHDKAYYSRPDFYVGEVEGFSLAFLAKNTVWDIVSSKDLEDPEEASKYKVLVAPDMKVVGDELEESLRSYVEQGGLLVATHEFGVMKPDYTYRHSLALQDLAGVSYEGVLWLGYSYLDLAGDPGLWAGLPRAVILGDHSTAFVRERAEPRLGEVVRARPRGSRVLAWVRMGRSGYGYEYTLGRSTPAPDSRLELAGISLARAGMGAVLYYSARIGMHVTRIGHPDYIELITRPIYSVAGEPPVVVEGPETVQVEAYEKDGGYNIHIVNHTYNQRILSAPTGPSKQAVPAFDPPYRVHPARVVVPVGPLKVRVRVRDSGRYRVVEEVSGDELRYEVKGQWLTMALPRVTEYALITVRPRG
ncbi:MAG: beta-galactosidase trimerization domain-containing protein [Desulfurococcales archaeon]|nr:beta-galactosidase trimerization domain-containing protein [Desulfurococcales archaeon]MCE4605662.1 beta-galactosidase trimerization domain-containing protein [Desulfurococcales archaeon]